jgi:nitrogen fixation/metabolism regulation signal transduction histidine kinase
MFEKVKQRIFLRILLLFITLGATSFLFVNGWYIYSGLVALIIIYQLIAMYKSQTAIEREFNQFVEAIRFRDFSRHFNIAQAPPELRSLRKGFNELNTLFNFILREKETQHYYLQKVLEMVNTGILSYEVESGKIIWMNESLKKMLSVPYLKTIQALSSRDENLYKEIIALKPGESKTGTVNKKKNPFKILLSATTFQMEEKKLNFVAFQNINEALDETEAKAWQKLLRVLTHEIMNSIAPISSLADTIKNRLASIDRSKDADQLDDIRLGIDTIKRRSENLLRFAEIYRNLNKISKPVLKTLYIRNLFENLYNLMQPKLEQKNIELEVILKDPNLVIEADTNLIEQVLINLLVNAIEALKDRNEPRIVLSAYATENEKVIIKIADNGVGIPEPLLDKVFVPFFSTKKAGSGIGLTLCKQIMMLHHGNIQVQSKESGGSAFLLQF